MNMKLPTTPTTLSDVLVDIDSFNMSIRQLQQATGRPLHEVRNQVNRYTPVLTDDEQMKPELSVLALIDLVPDFKLFVITRWMEFERQKFAGTLPSASTLVLTPYQIEQISQGTAGFDLENIERKSNFLTYRGASRKLGLERTELTGVLERADLIQYDRGHPRSTGNKYVMNHGIKDIKVNATAIQQDFMSIIDRVIYIRRNKQVD